MLCERDLSATLEMTLKGTIAGEKFYIMIVTLMTSSRTSIKNLKIPSLVAAATALIFILIPFHAFLSVWLSSIFGHYTALRLWKEVLLVVLTIKVAYLLVRDNKLRREFFSRRLNQMILLYGGVSIVWGFVALELHKVTAKALGYGLIVNLRFLAFFLIVWVAANKAPKAFSNWPKWLVWPLALVCLLGLLQYLVLPYDFLRHFGYGEQTIFPYETINHDIHRERVFSTLRGANPLGAYLLLVLSVLVVFWRKQRRLGQLALIISGIAVLFLSFSRSAWLGFALSLGVIGWYGFKSERTKQKVILVAAGLVVAIASLGFVMRTNTTLQDIVFHTNDRSTIATSSNDGHAAALRTGVREIIHQPLGRGVGSAGPASVYNRNQSRIAENYFLQVGQEVGWLGLALFIAINFYLARELWRRKHDSLALGLLAALAGLTFVNLLSHAWADDTLAYLFWGLAAIALVGKPKKPVE